MKKTALLLTLTLALTGCKVTSNSPGPGGNDGGGDRSEKGGSLTEAKRYFEEPIGAITPTLDGLWRQRESTKDQGYARKEALVFKGAHSMVFAVECHKLGMTVYSMVRVPIQKVRNQITVTQKGRYTATEKDEKSGTPLSCPAVVNKGPMYYSIINGETLCLSAKTNCRGNKSEFEKIRDDI